VDLVHFFYWDRWDALTLMKLQPSGPAAGDSPLEIQHSLRVLDRKDWWHWWNTILVIMLLMGAIAAISLLPKTLSDEDFTSQQQLDVAVHGLLGLVLIFNVYMLYQQHLLKQLRNHLASQIEVSTEQRVRAETLYEMAILDPLTGLYNRRFSEERLRAEIARADRHGNPLIAIVLDLDNFKGINDRYGHSAGDLVLKEFARRLSNAIRGLDMAVRLGGDEFLVILPECPPERVHLVLSRLAPFEADYDGKVIAVSSSRGWVQYQPGETPEQFIKRADEALYKEKESRHACALENLVA
jgi:diguanylate cyclase (GGDEF)-like protein